LFRLIWLAFEKEFWPDGLFGAFFLRSFWGDSLGIGGVKWGAIVKKARVFFCLFFFGKKGENFL
jgi:hypothetical protein